MRNKPIARKMGSTAHCCTHGAAFLPTCFPDIERRQLERLVRRAEDQEKRLIALPDQHLRQSADELRGRLSSASFDLRRDGLVFCARARGGAPAYRACAISAFSCSAALP